MYGEHVLVPRIPLNRFCGDGVAIGDSLHVRTWIVSEGCLRAC